MHRIKDKIHHAKFIQNSLARIETLQNFAQIWPWLLKQGDVLCLNCTDFYITRYSR